MVRFSKQIRVVLILATEVFLSALLCLMCFYSAIPYGSLFFKQDHFWLLVNCALVFFGIQLIYSLTGRVWISLLVSSVLAFLWSIADYYTVLYHGSPLFLDEYANFKTAMAVANTYSFSVDSSVIKEVIGFAVSLALVFFSKYVEKRNEIVKKKGNIKARIVAFFSGLIGIGAVFFVVLGPVNLKPETTMGWSWVAGVKKYGIFVCTIEDADNSIKNPVWVPEGYSLDSFSKLKATDEKPLEVYPDIILILNESFYDLEKFYEINPDVSSLESFYDIENAVYGFVPSGGGTNDSEYELLTSNSLFLLNGSSPFNFLDMKENPAHVVNYMKNLGYLTTGMHCGGKENYHRNSAYKDLGLDRVYLGTDDFKYRESNGGRIWLDSENYKEMLERMSNEDDSPQFVFLLTYQNHGGYDQNDASYDTVHSGIDYGENTSLLNEFLSSVKLSSDAFKELTESLKNSRPTLVAMVGDHSPMVNSFLQKKTTLTDFEFEHANQLVPYVIWSNYKEIPSGYGGFSSMEALAPMITEIAGLPLTPYYQKILELQETVPLRNPVGEYLDATKKAGVYSEESDYYNLLNEYYCMEYNSFDKENYRENLFLP